jgi:hypothetical protein
MTPSVQALHHSPDGASVPEAEDTEHLPWLRDHLKCLSNLSLIPAYRPPAKALLPCSRLPYLIAIALSSTEMRSEITGQEHKSCSVLNERHFSNRTGNITCSHKTSGTPVLQALPSDCEPGTVPEPRQSLVGCQPSSCTSVTSLSVQRMIIVGQRIQAPSEEQAFAITGHVKERNSANGQNGNARARTIRYGFTHWRTVVRQPNWC